MRRTIILSAILLGAALTACQKGNIKTSQLHIEAGAQFNGTCEMISEEFYNGYYNKLLEE